MIDVVVHQAASWHSFRIAELKAAAEALAIDVRIDDDELEAQYNDPSRILMRISAPDEASVVRLASRTVLAKSFVDVWASGETWDELAEALLAYSRDRAAPYLAEGSTFKVAVHSFGHSQTNDDRMEIIQKLSPLLPWGGKVNLKAPQHTFMVFVDYPVDVGGDGIHRSGKPPAAGSAPKVPRRYYFCRLLAEGRRDLVGKYDLKKRNYIGTTSLDAELSLLMANLARVRSHDLVYDPYCGTAGTLVAAGAFGARVLGCDLHLPAIRGELRTRSGPSKLKQAKVQGIPETFAQYGLPLPVDRLHGDSGEHLAFWRGGAGGGGGGGGSGGLFDAIISDPPYGIRERSAEVDDERYLDRTLSAEHMKDHVAHTAQAALEKILSDLFALCRRTLCVGGRLVFLLPTTEPFSASLLPHHPGLVLEGACEQQMAARWSRWCVIMRCVATIDDEATATTRNGHNDAAVVTPPLIYSAAGMPIELAPNDSSSSTISNGAGGGGGGGGSSGSGGIFNRASLRPDDLSNVIDAESAAAAATKVLHPRLLGKSAGARRRLEKRLAQAAGGTTTGADNADAAAAEETTSARSARRRTRNTGRGAYEDRVRQQLAASTADGSVGGAPGVSRWAALGLGALVAVGLVAAIASRRRA